MGKISKDIVEHVAKLAKLRLRKKEINKFGKQLSDIFAYVDQIGEMKTKNVSETSQVTGATNTFRDDVIDKKRMLTQRQALSNTKRKHKGYFVVESVFEK